MHLQLVSAEADQTMHLGATRVGLRSTRRAQARAAVRAGSVIGYYLLFWLCLDKVHLDLDIIPMYDSVVFEFHWRAS